MNESKLHNIEIVDVLTFDQLTEEEQKEYINDYGDQMREYSYARYGDNLYCIEYNFEMSPTAGSMFVGGGHDLFRSLGYDLYQCDTYFSAVLVKNLECNSHVQFALYM